jgi:hypothetical protein
MTVSVTWEPPVQAGVGTTAVWVNLATDLTMIQGTGEEIGLIFDARNDQTLRFNGDRILDPPTLLSATLSVTLSMPALSFLPVEIEIGAVPVPPPVNYSNTALPWSREEVSLGTFTLTTVATAPATTAVSLTLDRLVLAAQVTSRPWWNGRVALSVRVLTAGNRLLMKQGSGFTIGLATTQEEKFFHGLIGGPSGPRQRYVRDGRFGMPALNTELLRDGDNPALFVRAHDWDPEDPEIEYRPRSGEATVDDGIPE